MIKDTFDGFFQILSLIVTGCDNGNRRKLPRVFRLGNMIELNRPRYVVMVFPQLHPMHRLQIAERIKRSDLTVLDAIPYPPVMEEVELGPLGNPIHDFFQNHDQAVFL